MRMHGIYMLNKGAWPNAHLCDRSHYCMLPSSKVTSWRAWELNTDIAILTYSKMLEPTRYIFFFFFCIYAESQKVAQISAIAAIRRCGLSILGRGQKFCMCIPLCSLFLKCWIRPCDITSHTSLRHYTIEHLLSLPPASTVYTKTYDLFPIRAIQSSIFQ